jgi:hypothetical protein
MGLFDGLNQAPIGLQRLYFKAGRYLIQINQVKGITPQASFHGRGAFVVECIVLQSSEPALPPGSQPAWVQVIHSDTAGQRVAFGSIKQFFCAILGEESLQSTNVEELADMAVSDANPLSGIKLGLVCTQKTTKQGNEFTVHTWHSAVNFAMVETPGA